jgi:hypothetical protein
MLHHPPLKAEWPGTFVESTVSPVVARHGREEIVGPVGRARFIGVLRVIAEAPK